MINREVLGPQRWCEYPVFWLEGFKFWIERKLSPKEPTDG